MAQSDAETLCTLAAVGADSDLLTHARWLDVLGREAITNRFFRTLHEVITDLAASLTGRIDTAERRDWLWSMCPASSSFASSRPRVG